jgi:ubiquinone biosynthesis protein UbiJ
VLSGTPLALLGLMRAGTAARVEGSGATFTGDARTLESFARLFELARPDLEDELSRITGDAIAHETGRLAAALRSWAVRAGDALAMNTAEYLQEEARELPGRHEAEGFFRDIEQLRDDAARALLRAERLGVRPDASEDGSCADSA